MQNDISRNGNIPIDFLLKKNNIYYEEVAI